MIRVTGPRLIRSRHVPLKSATLTGMFNYFGNGATDSSIEEYEAYLRGEEVNEQLLLRYGQIANGTLPIRVGEEVSVLDRTGTVVLSFTKATLMRQFDLMRNYFTDNGDAKEIQLPYSSEEITDAMYPLLKDDDSTVRLTSCFDCVSYLMPTHTDYRLRFSLEGCTLYQLACIGEGLDTRTRSEIVYEFHVPMLGEGILAVASFVKDLAVLEEIVAYPSYLFYLLARADPGGSRAHDLVLRSTFEDHSHFVGGVNMGAIYKFVVKVGTKSKTWEEFVHCLTLLDLRCDLLGNTNSPGYLPYQAVPKSRKELVYLYQDPLRRQLAEFNRPGVTLTSLVKSLGIEMEIDAKASTD